MGSSEPLCIYAIAFMIFKNQAQKLANYQVFFGLYSFLVNFSGVFADSRMVRLRSRKDLFDSMGITRKIREL